MENNKNQGLVWLIFSNLLAFVTGVLYVLINFGIWSEGESLQRSVLFNLSAVSSLFMFLFIADKLVHIFSPKLSVLISIITFGATGLFSSIYFEDLSKYYILIGVLMGMSYSIRMTAFPIVDQAVTNKDTRVKFSSYLTILSSILSIAAPITIEFLVNSFDYKRSLLIVSLTYILFGIGIMFFKISSLKQDNALFLLLKNSKRDDKLKHVALISLSLGIAYSVDWGLIDILIITKLGSLNDWRNIKVLIAVINIIYSFVLGKINLKKFSHIRVIIGVSALAYSTLPIMLIKNFNNMTFIVFSIAQVIFYSTVSILLSNYLLAVIDDDERYDNRIASYQVFRNLFIGGGRVIPLGVMGALSIVSFSR
ncbi:MAG: hypothetical protein Q9M91_01125 [Candidatus Dojkabacteria bacterium]|nr:hypothetical protein [Candidatus Dojkabacteria bacterium]MDQ7020427.1 hypothetical protein [Candidatus Dojkabacteria bacterium]